MSTDNERRIMGPADGLQKMRLLADLRKRLAPIPDDEHQERCADHDDPIECACEAEQGQVDARRERYRLTVYRAIERGDDPADATMAVADEETAELRWELMNLRNEVERDRDENDRLRAELEEADENDRRRGAELFEKNATIERVRSVLGAADLSDRETGFYMDTRAALEGEQ